MKSGTAKTHGFVRVRGARENNLKNIDVEIPRDALVVFTGISGSGKSSLAFGTLYAESQRRYLESVAPYARRLIDQAGTPDVDAIDGLPPAVALQQRRGTPTARSSIGSLSGISNLVRLLYSRAGRYPVVQPMLYAEDFSPNTPEGACPHLDDAEYNDGDDSPSGEQSFRDLQDDDPGAASNGAGVVTAGRLTGLAGIKRLVRVDQKPIGRTPRSNLATYTGLFDGVRKLFAATPAAQHRRYGPGRFSFNVAQGRCPKCEGDGFVSVELLFLPSVYAPCPDCHGARYNPATLEIKWKDLTIAQVLDLTVKDACEVFADEPAVLRPLMLLRDIGLGYLRLGQPATELSGGEAQRIKLVTELQRLQHGNTLYVLDEPTTGLHPADVDRLLLQLDGLVQAGNTVVVVEHDMRVVAACDWVIDMGPGAGNSGGKVVVSGPPEVVAAVKASRTAPYLSNELAGKQMTPSARSTSKA
ncbi:hypothetical protein F7661_20540 [Pseudomonas sp. CFA]|nr:hypothetical protein F7661_20540 [Pseudomonas sp. CFA]